MKLKRLTIHRYRNLHPCSLIFNEEWNVVVGPTASGKSTLMGLLGLVLARRADLLACCAHHVEAEFFDGERWESRQENPECERPPKSLHFEQGKYLAEAFSGDLPILDGSGENLSFTERHILLVGYWIAQQGEHPLVLDEPFAFWHTDSMDPVALLLTGRQVFLATNRRDVIDCVPMGTAEQVGSIVYAKSMELRQPTEKQIVQFLEDAEIAIQQYSEMFSSRGWF